MSQQIYYRLQYVNKKPFVEFSKDNSKSIKYVIMTENIILNEHNTYVFINTNYIHNKYKILSLTKIIKNGEIVLYDDEYKLLVEKIIHNNDNIIDKTDRLFIKLLNKIIL